MSITGWLNVSGHIIQDEADFFNFAVKESPDQSKFVEIGAFKGRSALAMVDAILTHNKKVHFFSVDHFEGSSEHQAGAANEDDCVVNSTLYQEYCKNIEPYTG